MSHKRVLCAQLPAPGRPVPLSEAEADHLVRVLRLRDGDPVEALDGKGHAATTTLRTRGGGPRLEFLAEIAASAESSQALLPVTLEMAVLKGEAMEWVVEKAVELGVRTLIPVLTAHTVVQIKGKGPEAFQSRWQKIADQALKQCGRLEALHVLPPMELEDLLVRHTTVSREGRIRLWCDEADRQDTPFLGSWLQQKTATPESIREARILIGPEGGWSALERELLGRSPDSGGLQRVSLGPLVLRAETAALFASSLIASFFRGRPKTNAT